jgi:outer membrane immunogenic protein
MHKIISATALALVAFSTGSVLAADLPTVKGPPVYAPPPPPEFTWSGIYFGVNAGYAWSDRDTAQTLANDPTVTAGQFTAGTVLQSYGLHQDGITAGAQIGYNYEFSLGSNNGVVLGVEADGAYTDLDRSATYVGFASVTSLYHQSLDYLGTVRGRLGFAWDRFLIYGTGGFAYGNSHFGQSIVAGNDANALIWGGSTSHTQTGYAFGGGLEYALPPDTFLNPFHAGAVTLRVEYLHYDLGTSGVNLVGGLGAPYYFTDRYTTDGNIVRGGLNYLFDFAAPPTPVVAKY